VPAAVTGDAEPATPGPNDPAPANTDAENAARADDVRADGDPAPRREPPDPDAPGDEFTGSASLDGSPNPYDALYRRTAQQAEQTWTEKQAALDADAEMDPDNR
jgi:hypothetical protein